MATKTTDIFTRASEAKKITLKQYVKRSKKSARIRVLVYGLPIHTHANLAELNSSCGINYAAAY